MKTTILVAAGTLGFVGTLASCGASGDDGTLEKNDASVVLDGSGATVDGPDSEAGPACDGGDGTDGGCEERPLSCAEVDFCAVDAPVLDTRWALTALGGTSKNDVWAVGSAGAIVHFDGTSWTAVPSGTKQTLYGVWPAAPNDVWAVGAFDLVLHGTGAPNSPLTWVRDRRLGYGIEEIDDEYIAMRPIYAVVGRAENVFLGGDVAAYGYPGPSTSTWRAKPGDGGVDWLRIGDWSWNVRGMWLSPMGELWTVGDNDVQHANIASGSGVAPYPDTLAWSAIESWTSKKLHGVWGASDTNIWMVGTHGTIRHWRGGPATETVASPTTDDLFGIWGSGPDNVWAVGDHGTILHFDGATWTSSVAAFPSRPAPRLLSVWGSDPSNVWIAGDGIILRLTSHGAAQ